jgi:phosphatidylethanolamine N-methyltransferase
VGEIKGTFDKVFEETADIVEEFLAKCKYDRLARGVTILMHIVAANPEYQMQETKVLLQQSRERLVVTSVGSFSKRRLTSNVPWFQSRCP